MGPKTLFYLLRPLEYPIKTKIHCKVSKKRKFVADGVFNAELNEFLARTLGHATIS